MTLLLAGFHLLYIPTLRGQGATTGDIRGMVLDQSGAAVPGAALRFEDQDTDIVVNRVSSSDGSYSCPSVRPGKLNLSVTAIGFAPAEVVGMVVVVGRTTFQDIVLKPAAVKAVADVKGSELLVQSGHSEISEVIDRKSVDSFPLKDRSLADLTTTVPQITAAPAVDPTKVRVSNISVAGTTGRQSNVLVDGFENYDPLVGGLAYNISPEAIEELNVVTTRFTAEQGRSVGAIVNIIGRSGTNDLHGSAFYFLRTQDLAAKDYFEDQLADFRRQQSGFTLGGPFRRSKLFGFAAFDDRHEVSPGIINTNGAFPQFDRTVPVPFREDLFSGKSDYNASNKERIFVRVNLDNLDDDENIGGNADVSAGWRNTTTDISVAANQTYQISGNALNSFGLQYTSFSNALTPLSNMPGEIRPSLITGIQVVGRQSNTDRRIQFKEDLYWVSGRHSPKVGVEFQHLYFSGAWSYAKEGVFEFFEDAPLSATRADLLMMNQCDTPDCNTGVITSNIYAAYLHDDWKVTNKLTVNMGVRWDYFTNETGKQFKGIAGLLVPPGSRGTNPWNFAPRLGFAFAPTAKGNLVLRGGYGVYFQNLVLTDIAVEQAFNAQAISYKLFLNPGNIVIDDPFPGMTPEQLHTLFFSPPYNTFILLKNGLKTPYYQYASAGMQWSFIPEAVLSIDGVHMLGVKGLFTRDINVDPDFRIASPNSPLCLQFGNSVCQQFGALAYEDNGSVAHYNALVVSVRKPLRKRAKFEASYTFSKTENLSDDSVATEGISPVSNPFNLNAERGPAITDERHRFVLTGILDMSRVPPFFGHGWQLSAVSAFATPLPFEVLTASPAPDGISISRPPGITRNEGDRGSQTRLLKLINSYRISKGLPAIVRPLTPQNLNMRYTDIRLSKSLFLRDSGVTVSLMAECFNLFNQTNFISNSGPGGGWIGKGVQNIADSDSVGKARSTPGVLGVGGPRTIEFGARLRF